MLIPVWINATLKGLVIPHVEVKIDWSIKFWIVVAKCWSFFVFSKLFEIVFQYLINLLKRDKSPDTSLARKYDKKSVSLVSIAHSD